MSLMMFFVSPVGRRRFETVARTPAAVDCYVESEVRGFSFKLVNFSLLFFRIVPKTRQAGCSRPGCLSAFSHLLVVIPLADSGMRFSPERTFFRCRVFFGQGDRISCQPSRNFCQPTCRNGQPSRFARSRVCLAASSAGGACSVVGGCRALFVGVCRGHEAAQVRLFAHGPQGGARCEACLRVG